MQRTTIAVQPSTRDALKRLGRKGETYDTILRRLLQQTGNAPRRRKVRPPSDVDVA